MEADYNNDSTKNEKLKSAEWDNSSAEAHIVAIDSQRDRKHAEEPFQQIDGSESVREYQTMLPQRKQRKT